LKITEEGETGGTLLLIGIPKIIPPELMKVMMEMGHGDELVLADGNFPAAANAQRLIRCDGLGSIELLQAILNFFPLEYRREVAALMQIPSELNLSSSIQIDYFKILQEVMGKEPEIKYEQRDDFYARSRNAFAIVATGETARFASIIIRKGIIVN
jgi:L-fucose mutarotase